MKALEEVIKAIEYCEIKKDDCFTCPYKSDSNCYALDALHYLKEYLRYQNTPSRNGHMALVDYFEESQKNEPLTWDELKLMEGMPVWYEHEFWKGWIILGKVEQGVNCEMIPDREERWYIVKDGSAKAYRKERK